MAIAELFEFPTPVARRRSKPKKETKVASYSAEFELFWSSYPRKLNCSKFEASKSWDKLSEDMQRQALASVPIFARQCAGKDEQYICHPATWLNQRRWETVVVSLTNSPSAAISIDWSTILKIYAKTNNWNYAYGPAPDEKGYRGPPLK